MKLRITGWARWLLVPLLATSAAAQYWVETEKVLASDADGFDRFGHSVALYRDTAVAGAVHDEAVAKDAGSAYVLERNLGGPNAWGEVVKLTASNGAIGDLFGGAVAVQGDVLAVGASLAAGAVDDTGAVYVYERDLGGPAAWGEAVRLFAADGAAKDCYGWALALSGNALVVGVPCDGDLGPYSGGAYVYERSATGRWAVVTKLLASDGGPSEFFGTAVAMHGDLILVGAKADSAAPGAAYIYARDQGGPGAWGELAKLTASDGQPQDSFGSSVRIGAEVAVVGAVFDDHPGGALDGGSVYVFERDFNGLNAWGEARKLQLPNPKLVEYFGEALALSGDTVFVGAKTNTSAVPVFSSPGSVFVYRRDLGGASNWGLHQTIHASDPSSSARFGSALAISGSTLLAGSRGDHLGTSGSVQFHEAGSAYFLEGGDGLFVYCTAGTSGGGCIASVSASGMASATASAGFLLSAASVEGNRNGLFLYSASGRQAVPWGSGTSFQCVAPPVNRGVLLPAVGTLGSCDGSFSWDLNAQWCPGCPQPHLNPGPGVDAQAQLWYRDPSSTSNQPTSFSDAIEFIVAP